MFLLMTNAASEGREWNCRVRVRVKVGVTLGGRDLSSWDRRPTFDPKRMTVGVKSFLLLQCFKKKKNALRSRL